MLPAEGSGRLIKIGSPRRFAFDKANRRISQAGDEEEIAQLWRVLGKNPYEPGPVADGPK